MSGNAAVLAAPGKGRGWRETLALSFIGPGRARWLVIDRSHPVAISGKRLMDHYNPSDTENSGAGALARVAKNTATLITLRVVMPAISLLLVFALSRLLGAE